VRYSFSEELKPLAALNAATATTVILFLGAMVQVRKHPDTKAVR
jgi:hypothetical protein